MLVWWQRSRGTSAPSGCLRSEELNITTTEAAATDRSDAVPRVPRVLAIIPGDGQGSSFIFARRQVESLRRFGLDIHLEFFDSRSSITGILRNCRRIRTAARDLRADIIHVHYGTMTAFATALATGKPLVITFRGSDLQPEAGVAKIRALAGLLVSQLASLRASHVICVSDRLKRRLWWRKNSAEVLPVGVNLNRFKPEPRSSARERLGWDPHESVVLFNAGTAPVTKGLDLAEAAIKEAVAVHGPIRFEVMRGDVPTERVPILMNAADCLVITSRSEGSPGVVKEALACNLPIISVDVGDVVERLRGVTASCIVERDAKQISRAIISVLSSKTRSNGRERIAELSEAHIAERLCSIYSSILSRETNGITATASAE